MNLYDLHKKSEDLHHHNSAGEKAILTSNKYYREYRKLIKH